MLKLLPQQIETFHNVKCGEIFYTTAAVFNVSCSLCGSTMHMDQFVGHFQAQHLTLAEESINIEVLEKKCNGNLTNDLALVEDDVVREIEPGFDPIKEEQSFEDHDAEGISYYTKEQIAGSSGIEDDEDNMCLQERFLAAKAKKKKYSLKKNAKNNVSSRHVKNSELIVKEEKNNKGPIQEETPCENSENDNRNNSECKDFDASDKDFKSNSDMRWSSDEEYTEENTELEVKPEEVLPFPCHICNRAYRNKNCLRRHTNNVHNPKNLDKAVKKTKAKHKCEECGEVFSSARNLSGHKWKHTGIYCDICGKQFTQVGNMTRHKIRHTGEKEFKCKECTKEFFTAKELRMHMLCHSKFMPVMCEICGKGCRDRGVLTAHMRRHTGERPAKCDKCGKRFFSIHDLNVHAVAHTDARPFKCDICGSTFQRKKALRIHKLIHSNNRKHLCQICGKGFALSSGLNSHLKTHDAAVRTSVIRNSQTSVVTDNPTVSFPSRETEEEIQQMDENVNIGKELEHHITGEFMI